MFNEICIKRYIWEYIKVSTGHAVDNLLNSAWYIWPVTRFEATFACSCDNVRVGHPYYNTVNMVYFPGLFFPEKITILGISHFKISQPAHLYQQQWF